MSTPVRRRIENAFRSAFAELIPTANVLAAGNAVQAAAPFIVVRCARVEEITPGSFCYRFYLRVVPVSSIHDDQDSTAHDQLVRDLSEAIAALPRRGEDSVNGIAITGWVITEDESAEDEGQTYADVIAIEGGAVDLEETPPNSDNVIVRTGGVTVGYVNMLNPDGGAIVGDNNAMTLELGSENSGKVMVKIDGTTVGYLRLFEE